MKSRQIYSVDQILNMSHYLSVEFLLNYRSSLNVIDDRLIAPCGKTGLNHVYMCCEIFSSMKDFGHFIILYQITSMKIEGSHLHVINEFTNSEESYFLLSTSCLNSNEIYQ